MPWYPTTNGLRADVLEYMKVLERLKNQSDCTPSSFPFYGPFLRPSSLEELRFRPARRRSSVLNGDLFGTEDNVKSSAFDIFAQSMGSIRHLQNLSGGTYALGARSFTSISCEDSLNQLVENIHYLHMVHSRRLEIRFYAAALHERTRMSFFNKSAAPSPMVFPRAQIKKGDEPPAVRINISEGNTTEFCETIIKSQSTRVLPLALYKHAMNTLWRGSASMKVRSTFVHVLYQVSLLPLKRR
ncbi:hypothetical protein IAS59_003418 [Cryptococcus gattii]